MLKFEPEYFAYPQLVVLASSYLLPNIMEHIIGADEIFWEKKGSQIELVSTSLASFSRSVCILISPILKKDINAGLIRLCFILLSRRKQKPMPLILMKISSFSVFIPSIF